MNQATNTSDHGNVIAGLIGASGNGERALAELKAAGLTRVEISQVSDESDDASNSTTRDVPAYDVGNEGSAVGGQTAASANPFFQNHDSTASTFVSELVRLGFSKHDAHDLVDGLVKGEALVTADAGTHFDEVVAILHKYQADIRYSTGAKTPATASVAPSSVPPAVGVPASKAETTNGDQAIELRAERLLINKQRVQHGEARVRKEIVTEMKSIDVPVSHEELIIERHAVRDDGTIDTAPIAAETIRIPLTQEKVNVSKQTVVLEEVEVGKRRVEGVEHIRDTVRHEELRVDDTPASAPNAP